MPRRPKADVDIPVTVNGVTYRVATSTMTAIPATPLFLKHLIDRQISTAMAGEYARLAAKLVRDGKTRPEQLSKPNERTAMNAYWRWIESSYEKRVQAVQIAMAPADLRKAFGWLRVHSISPPFEGKTVPRLTQMPQLYFDAETHAASMEPERYERVPCTSWTLHVPEKETPVHADPCDTCAVYELTPEQLTVIAAAFEDAWGHRDIGRMPPEALLFGTPPMNAERRAQAATETGRVVGLIHPCTLSDHVMAHGGHVADSLPALISRLNDGPADVLVLSRTMIGEERFDAVVQALGEPT